MQPANRRIFPMRPTWSAGVVLIQAIYL